MQQKQKGFSVVEVLLVMMVLAIVGFAGWWAWRAHHKDDNKPTAASSQAAPTQTTYLTLTDYHVRLPLDSTTDKLSLGQINTINEKDKSITVIASQLDDGWKCAADPVGFKGEIGKISITTQAKRLGPGAPVVAKKIGSYTYGFEPGAANCTDSPQYGQLVDAFKMQFTQLASY